MGFRDDREALRRKLDATEEELEASERRGEELARELDGARAELEKVRAGTRPPRRSLATAIAGGLVFCGVVVAVLAFGALQEEDPLVDIGPIAPRDPSPEPLAAVPGPEPEEPDWRLPPVATWSARVTFSDHPSIPVGRECEIRVSPAAAFLPAAASVVCGDDVLFFGMVEGTGDSDFDTCCAFEAIGAPRLVCRTERERIDTAAGTADLSQDDLPVQLEIRPTPAP